MPPTERYFSLSSMADHQLSTVPRDKVQIGRLKANAETSRIYQRHLTPPKKDHRGHQIINKRAISLRPTRRCRRQSDAYAVGIRYRETSATLAPTNLRRSSNNASREGTSKEPPVIDRQMPDFEGGYRVMPPPSSQGPRPWPLANHSDHHTNSRSQIAPLGCFVLSEDYDVFNVRQVPDEQSVISPNAVWVEEAFLYVIS